jgi:uncharacterized protein (TIGR00255 family)
MLKSMTGFGHTAGCADGLEFDVEVRTVNNRYFKPSFRLPELWGYAEAAIEKKLRDQIVRGSVTVTVRMKLSDEQAAAEINPVVLKRYVDQLQAMDVESMEGVRIDLATLLQLPGVCQSPVREDLRQRGEAVLLSLIDDAAAAMMNMRLAEGQGLADDLLGHCDALEGLLAQARERAPGVVADYQSRLESRIADLLASGKLEMAPDMIAREVAMFADRCDIAEELQRLGGHIELFRQVVASGEASGRKLDFVAQEMLREANTIGSKGNDSELARVVVDMKTAIDRIKEQVQNVE